jgi:hypothetical protein
MQLEFEMYGTFTRYFNTNSSSIDIIVFKEALSTDIETLDGVHFNVNASNVDASNGSFST